MGFTVRFMLGTVLVLLCCWSIETSRLIRQTDNGESKPVQKLQKIENETTIQQSIVANLSEENNKPKTDFSTENNRTLDKQASLISKLQKAETYKKATSQPDVKNTREDIARSIDIQKYLSKEFHNKNNVYTLPMSADTERYVDPDYRIHSTPQQDYDRNKEFHFDLTTPKSLIFDHKYKEAVESVEQKLEHIDDDSHELALDVESSNERFNLEKLYEETKNNDTKANLNYINYKNIISNDTTGKNSIQKDLVVEAGTNLDFHSSYNETKTIDDHDDGNNTIIKEPPNGKVHKLETIPDQEKSESSTSKSIILTTKKSLVTKPTSNKNSSHISILSNNIETETLKAINSAQLNLFTSTERPKERKEEYARSTTIDITKREFTENVQTTQPTVVANEITKKKEQLFQENQVYPILVEAPTSTTTEDPKQRSEIPIVTTTEKTTTEASYTTENFVTRAAAVTEAKTEELTTVKTTEKTTVPTTQQEANTETLTSVRTTEKAVVPTTPLESKTEALGSVRTTETTIVPTTQEAKTESFASVRTTVPTTQQEEKTEALITEKNSEAKTELLTSLRTTEKTIVPTTQYEETTTLPPPPSTTAGTTTSITIAAKLKMTSETTTTASKITTIEPGEVTEITMPVTTIEASTQTDPVDITVISNGDLTTTESFIITTASPATDDLLTTTLNTDSMDAAATTEVFSTVTTSLDNLDKDLATTTESAIKLHSSSEFDRNSSITTENSMRTSKAIVFRETVPTTEPIFTAELPTTTELNEATTVEIVEPKTEPITTTTVEPIFVVYENHTFVPKVRQELNDSTESETTTESNTVSSDSDELSTMPPDDGNGTVAAIAISSIGAVCLVLLAGIFVFMRKRQKRFNYRQRCTPVSLNEYNVDNTSIYNSVRRKGALRSSKTSYTNQAFEDPVSVSHPLNFPALGKFATNLEDIQAEFEEIPQITARTNELPEGCDIKNRYANVIPLPETRVYLTFIDGYPNSDYINANYVTGPNNVKKYYIACQAPMQNTVDDFWKMIWEQQSKVILMLTHLFENGVEKCVDYLPPSEVLDCHRAFGDYLVTLKKREVKDKYIISILQLKNMVSSSWREVTHFWYLGWPEKGVPSEANSLIAFLIEARSYMKSSSIDRRDVNNGNLSNGSARNNELNPVVVHCSPGTGRTGVVIACDIAIREFEQSRLVDVPRIVYKIRRDRASSVQTKEQYAFIYKVISLYATKLTGGALDSL